MDTFQKLDVAIDGSVRRNERLYFEMGKELNKPTKLYIEISGQRQSE
jgi:hypothetical protein